MELRDHAQLPLLGRRRRVGYVDPEPLREVTASAGVLVSGLRETTDAAAGRRSAPEEKMVRRRVSEGGFYTCARARTLGQNLIYGI